jgi:hypothetical protein
MGGRGAVADYGSRTTPEHSGHPCAVRRDDPVANRVDTAVEAVKAAPLDSVIDSPRTQAHRQQLLSSNDAVLSCRELRYEPVEKTLARFYPTMGYKCASVWHGAIVAGRP